MVKASLVVRASLAVAVARATARRARQAMTRSPRAIARHAIGNVVAPAAASLPHQRLNKAPQQRQLQKNPGRVPGFYCFLTASTSSFFDQACSDLAVRFGTLVLACGRQDSAADSGRFSEANRLRNRRFKYGQFVGFFDRSEHRTRMRGASVEHGCQHSPDL